MVNLFNWLLGLTNTFSQFLTWLTSTLPLLNMSPLDVISFSGLTAVLGFVIVRLVIGG